MPVPCFTDLDKLDRPTEMIDDRLIAGRIPPLGREVVFPSGNNDPELLGYAMFSAWDWCMSLGFSQMQVARKASHRDAEAELLFEVLGIAVQKVVGTLVALMNK